MAPTDFLTEPAWGSSLPLVSTLQDTASWTTTVEPYIAHLRFLPWRILEALGAADVSGLVSIYAATNPLISGFALSVALAPVFFAVSEANRNYSQVDRCWSLLPTVYNAHFWTWAWVNGIRSARLDAVLVLSVIWSVGLIRLTFNYWRRGGYSIGSEDYRWLIVKNYVNNALVWVTFNATFISLIQSVLLFAVTMPTYILILANQFTGPSLKPNDIFFIVLILSMIAIEFTADGQQWHYHAAKQLYREKAQVPRAYGYTRDDLDRGFNTTGLFRFCRHPNFAAEQTIWVAMYAWSCVETMSPYNWTGVGALSYLALFQGSTWLTELISTGKYPEYREYQRRVGRFLPNLSGQSWREHLEQEAAGGIVVDDSSSDDETSRKTK